MASSGAGFPLLCFIFMQQAALHRLQQLRFQMKYTMPTSMGRYASAGGRISIVISRYTSLSVEEKLGTAIISETVNSIEISTKFTR